MVWLEVGLSPFFFLSSSVGDRAHLGVSGAGVCLRPTYGIPVGNWVATTAWLLTKSRYRESGKTWLTGGFDLRVQKIISLV